MAITAAAPPKPIVTESPVDTLQPAGPHSAAPTPAKVCHPAPWSIALESGAASGWPASDWVQEIFIHDHGPDLYDLWVNHQIPWTHPAVRSSFEKFGSVALKPGYVHDGMTGLLVTDPAPAGQR